MNSELNQFAAFLRGINVGGHHKIAMAELKSLMTDQGFFNVKTLLNSGNMVFTTDLKRLENLELQISAAIEKQFGFPVPVMVRTTKELQEIIAAAPFPLIAATDNTQHYITLLGDSAAMPQLPISSDEGAIQILAIHHRAVYSKLDFSKTKTVKAMALLEKHFGKNITTRTWSTLLKLEKTLHQY